MKPISRMLLMMLVILMGTGMTSCEFFNDNPVSPRLKVRASSMTVQVGASRKCNVSASTRAKLLYASSDEKIATVNEKGIVTGVSEGDAVITVVATNKEGTELFFDESAVIAVKVVAKDSELTEEEQLAAEAVALVEEAQQEGSVTTLMLTLDGVEYPFTFKMENGQFVLQTAAGTRGNIDEALSRYNVMFAATTREEANKKQTEEEKKFAPDPAYDDDDDLFNGDATFLGDDFIGEWTDEDEKNLLQLQKDDPDFVLTGDLSDSELIERINQSKAEYPANDAPGASIPDTDESDPILDVTVEDKASGEMVLAAQYDPATYSLTQTGEKGCCCSSTLTVNDQSKDISPKKPTCSITYPDGKVKYMYFKSGKYQTWGELIKRFTSFGKISDYIFNDNYWLCETDGKTLVTTASAVKASYLFCHKVNKIKLEFDKKKKSVSVGDKFRVKVETFPADALVSGVFEVSYNKDYFCIESVNGEKNLFEISALEERKATIAFAYKDYAKKFKIKMHTKIKGDSQTEPEPTSESDQKNGSITFGEPAPSVTWSATAGANTYKQEVTKTGDGTVTYSISHNTCGASINASTGEVKFTQVGNVRVTAKVENTKAYVYETKEVGYYLTVNKADAAISFKDASVTKTYGDGKFTIVASNTGDGTVKYSSDKTSVAVVNATSGEVEIKGVGTATITATVSGAKNYQYAKEKVSYTLEVKPAGTISDYDKKESQDW